MSCAVHIRRGHRARASRFGQVWRFVCPVSDTEVLICNRSDVITSSQLDGWPTDDILPNALFVMQIVPIVGRFYAYRDRIGDRVPMVWYARRE